MRWAVAADVPLGDSAAGSTGSSSPLHAPAPSPRARVRAAVAAVRRTDLDMVRNSLLIDLLIDFCPAV
ncbi:hypothetical protein JCM10369A_27200 [Nocardioides pyridinolyticus]